MSARLAFMLTVISMTKVATVAMRNKINLRLPMVTLLALLAVLLPTTVLHLIMIWHLTWN